VARQQRRHRYFTEDEWDDLDRVTKRWSEAGRAREHLFDRSPVSGDLVKTVYEEEHDAASDYHTTIRRILDAVASRGWREVD
jgi:hypothetical protein